MKLFLKSYIYLPHENYALINWTTSSKNRARYFYCCTIIKERELEREVIFAFAFLVGLSSRPDVFCKKVLLEISQKSQGNTLPEFLNKVAGLRPATLLKKRPWLRCFSVSFVKFLRTPFLTKHLQHLSWLKNKFCYWDLCYATFKPMETAGCQCIWLVLSGLHFII